MPTAHPSRRVVDGLLSARPSAHCAGEGKWAPGSCRCAMDEQAAGDRAVAAVSWRPLPGPAGAHFAVEKQLGAAWHPAKPPPATALPLWRSVYPAVSPNWGLGDSVHRAQGVVAGWAMVARGTGVWCRVTGAGALTCLAAWAWDGMC